MREPAFGSDPIVLLSVSLVPEKRELYRESRRPASRVSIRIARVAHETVSEAEAERHDTGHVERQLSLRLRDEGCCGFVPGTSWDRAYRTYIRMLPLDPRRAVKRDAEFIQLIDEIEERVRTMRTRVNDVPLPPI